MPTGLQEPKEGGLEISLATDLQLSFSPLNRYIACFQTVKDQVRVSKSWDQQLLIHIVRKSTPRFTRFRSLVLIRLVLTEIQRFKNVKINKEMYIWHPDQAVIDCASKSGILCQQHCFFFWPNYANIMLFFPNYATVFFKLCSLKKCK